MKRILSFTVFFAITVMAFNPFYAFAATGKLTVTVGTVTGKAGQSVSVPITVSGNSGIVQFYSNLSYDNTKLTLESITNGTVFTEPAHGNDLTRVPFTLNWDMSTAPKANTTNGIIVTLNFRIKTNIVVGDIAIMVTPTFVSDFDLNSVAFETVAGKVSVISAGDEGNASSTNAADNSTVPTTSGRSDEETKTNSIDDNSKPTDSKGTIDVPIIPSDKTPWDKVFIENTDNKNITTEQTNEGLIIRGDDLSDVSANIQKGTKEATIPINTNNHEVLIKENKDGDVTAYVDTDGDGVFETEIARASFEDILKSKLPLMIGIIIPAIVIIALALWWHLKKKSVRQNKV